MINMQLINHRGGEQVASIWDEGGRLIVFYIMNDGNYLPYVLIEAAAFVALRGGHDPEGIKARFVEVVEQGGGPAPISIAVIFVGGGQ